MPQSIVSRWPDINSGGPGFEPEPPGFVPRDRDQPRWREMARSQGLGQLPVSRTTALAPCRKTCARSYTPVDHAHLARKPSYRIRTCEADLSASAEKNKKVLGSVVPVAQPCFSSPSCPSVPSATISSTSSAKDVAFATPLRSRSASNCSTSFRIILATRCLAR
jgi:hypothetical protein